MVGNAWVSSHQKLEFKVVSLCNIFCNIHLKPGWDPAQQKIFTIRSFINRTPDQALKKL